MSIKLFGHEEAQDFFRLGVHQKRLPHAFLLVGPEGVGKKTFATWCIEQLIELSPSYQNQRALYQTVAIDALPFVTHVQEPYLEAVRLVGGFLRRMLPHPDDWRIVLIEEGDMSYATQAALLKNLEEPPPKTVFFLLTRSEGRMAWPLRSRCQVVHLRPLSRQKFLETWPVFAVQHKIEPGDALTWFDVSGGCLGRAYHAALQEQDEDLIWYRGLLSTGLLHASHPKFVSPFLMETQERWARLRPSWLYEHFYAFVTSLLVRVYDGVEIPSETDKAIAKRLSMEAWSSFLSKARTLCREADVFNLDAMHVAPFLLSLGFAKTTNST